MDAKTIKNISQQVARQFPEVADARPNVRSQVAAKNTAAPSTYLLTYNSRVAQPGGIAFNRSVRVVADEAGRILKITTSR